MVIGVVTYPTLTAKFVDAGIFSLTVIVTVLDVTEQPFMLIPVIVHNEGDAGTDTSDPITTYTLPPLSIAFTFMKEIVKFADE